MQTKITYQQIQLIKPLINYKLKTAYQNCVFIQKPIYYVRDAQGNVMATYPHFSKLNYSTNEKTFNYKVCDSSLNFNYLSADAASYSDYYPFGVRKSQYLSGMKYASSMARYVTKDVEKLRQKLVLVHPMERI